MKFMSLLCFGLQLSAWPLQRQNFAVSQNVICLICTDFQIRTNVCTGVIKTDGFIFDLFPPYKGAGSAYFKR